MSRLRTLLRGRSELGVAALLGVIATVIAIDTLGIRETNLNVGVLGPRVIPGIVAAGLFLCAALLAIDVVRGGRGDPEEGEDVDLDTGTDWKTLLGLGGVILGSAVLIELAGYPIASALLFYGASIVLGSRHFVRDAIIAVVLAVATFYAFVVGLGIRLPAGLLQGIL